MKIRTALSTLLLFIATTSPVLASSSDAFSISGDIRLRFDNQVNYNEPNFSAEKYRIRLNLGYKLSPEWSFNSRLVVGESLFGDAPGHSSSAYPVVADAVQYDIANFSYKKPDWNIAAGRQVFSIFEGLAVSLDDGHSTGDVGYPSSLSRPDGARAKNYPSLDGVKAQNKIGKVNFTSFIGNLNGRISDGSNCRIGGIAAITPVGHTNIGAMWYTSDAWISASDAKSYGLKTGTKNGYSITANTKLLNNYLYTGAEYIWGLAESHDKAWKLIVKTPDTKKAGDMQYALEYRNIQQNALDYTSYSGGNYNSTNYGLSSAYKSITYGDYNYWSASAKRLITKSTYATLYFEKYNPTKHGSAKGSQVEDHVTRLELGYSF